MNEGCQHTDHLKIKLIKKITHFEHTGCFDAWMYDFKKMMEKTLNDYNQQKPKSQDIGTGEKK